MILEEFKEKVKDLFQSNSRLLTLIRFSGAGGSREYLFIESFSDLLHLLEISKQRDSITVFKEISILKEGIVNDNLINYLHEVEFKELLFVFRNIQRNELICEWDFIEEKSELKEILDDYENREVTVVLEPEFWNEENTYHVYYPDEKGKYISGVY